MQSSVWNSEQGQWKTFPKISRGESVYDISIKVSGCRNYFTTLVLIYVIDILRRYGAVYEGQWVNNQRSGKGHYIWANGDDYEGEWKNNMADGEGTLRTADGTKYKGHFVKGKEDGKGVLEDKNGVRYDGFFKQGKKHGAFVETDKNGNVIRKGVYKFGTLDAEQK